jgi:hypothetical protein
LLSTVAAKQPAKVKLPAAFSMFAAAKASEGEN